MSRTKRNIIPILILTMLFVLSFSVTSVFAASLSKKNVKIGKNNVYVLYLYGASGNVQWTSKKKGVAQIVTGDSTKAIIRAKKKGKSVITANVNGQKITCKFNVKDTKGIPKTLTVLAGDSVVFQQNKKKGTWSTSNPEIGYVEGTGKKKRVSFYNPGIVVITETIGDRRYSCTVTVIDRNTGTTTSYDDTSNPSNSGGGSSGGIIFPPYNPSTPARDTIETISTPFSFEKTSANVILGSKTVIKFTPVTHTIKYHNSGKIILYDVGDLRFEAEEWNSEWRKGVLTVAIDNNAHTVTLDVKAGAETLKLPVTGKVTFNTGGGTISLNVTINDYGTPDKTILNGWLRAMKTSQYNSQKGYLDYLTNCTYYIAENYPYRSDSSYMYSNGTIKPEYKYINSGTNPQLSVFGYIPAFAEKHNTKLGANCAGSTNAIVTLARAIGLQAREHDASGYNDNHETAQVLIDGHWYDFECGLVGGAPRGWSVCDVSNGGEMIAYGPGDHNNYESIGYVYRRPNDYRKESYYPN